MRKSDYLISEFALILARTAIVQWLFVFGIIQSNVLTAGLNGTALFALFIISNIIAVLLLNHQPSMAVFVAVGIAITVGMGILASRLFVLEPFDPDANISVHIIICAASAENYGMAYNRNPGELIIGKFDLLVVLLTFLLFVNHLTDAPGLQGALIWCLAAMGVLVAVCAYARAANGRSVNRKGEAFGKLGIAFLLAAVSALTAAVVSGIQSGSKRFTEIIVDGMKQVFFACARAIAFVCSMMYRFFLWLSRFGSKEEELPMPPAGEQSSIPMATGEETEVASPLWFKILLALIALALIILIFKKLSKIRTKTSVSFAMSENVKRENLFAQKIRAFFRAVSDKAVYLVFCLSRRNTVPGLLAYCEKKVPLKKKRKLSESGEAFLRRLAADASEQDRATLLELADLCEKHYYSGSKPQTGKDICLSVRRLSF